MCSCDEVQRDTSLIDGGLEGDTLDGKEHHWQLLSQDRQDGLTLDFLCKEFWICVNIASGNEF